MALNLHDEGLFQPFLSILRRNDLDFEIRDDFDDTRAAGSVDGTPADPGPGTRTVTDTGNNLSVGSGVMSLVGGADGDPGLWYGSIDRVLGKALLCRLRFLTASGYIGFGIDDNQALLLKTGIFKNHTISLNVISNFTHYNVGPSLALDTDYYFAMVMRGSVGMFWFIKGGIFTEWNLLWYDETENISPVYPSITETNVPQNTNVDFIRSTLGLWYPRPLVSDGFAATNPVVDHGQNGFSETPVNIGFKGSDGGWFNGVDSEIDISTNIGPVLDRQEGAMIVRATIPNTDLWSSTQTRSFLSFYLDANNFILIRKANAANIVRLSYTAGGVESANNITSISDTTPQIYGFSWSLSEDEIKLYLNGSQYGSTLNSLGTFASGGTPVVEIGAFAGVPSHRGYIQDAIFVFGYVPSAADMSVINSELAAGTLTAADLDDLLGAGNWAWYRLTNNLPKADGAGHAEADGGGGHYEGATAYIESGVLKNDPPVGNDGVTNGDFTNWTADDPDGWTVTGEVGADPEVSEVGANEGHGGVGTGSCNIYTTSAGVNIRQDVLTAGKFYRAQVSFTNKVIGEARLYLGADLFYIFENTGDYVVYGKATDNFFYLRGTPSAAIDITLDDAQSSEVELKDLITVKDVGQSDVIAEVEVTTGEGDLSGLALNVDDPDNPQNMVFIQVSNDNYGTNYTGKVIIVDKMVGGVWSNVANVAATYGAGNTLKVIKDSSVTNLYRIFYNGALIGSYSITDAGIVDNTYHGVLLAGDTASLDNLQIWQRQGGQNNTLDRYIQ